MDDSARTGRLAMTFRTSAALPIFVAALLLPNFAAQADTPIALEARLAQPVMKSGETQQNFLRIGLNGCEPKRNDSRNPVNVAFVIDRSGSMAGARIAQARDAAIMAINRLDANDIASVVIFDDKVDVLVPARQVDDHAAFTDRIRQIGVRGNTAIHDGVLEGASEVRKFKDQRRLNRVVLLSDGQANVGPRRPEDFASLGRALLGEGISVSTIGLGLDYNEDLMLQLARAGDGNHAFASAPDDLIQIFNREFDDVLAACAQTVSIDVELRPGVKVVRALSREGNVAGERATFTLNQVYAATEHYVLLELEFEGKAAGDDQDMGRVHVAYTVPETGARQAVDAPIRGRFSAAAAEVKAGRDQAVMTAVVEQTARERAQQAVKLRDQGQHAEAARLFQQNVEEIQSFQSTLAEPSKVLDGLQSQYGVFSRSAIAPAAPASQWMMERKLLRQMDSGRASGGARY
jgi:Ca-activated chloride channel family protein